MPKMFYYSTTKNTNNGEIILIKSDNPKYTYEVYWKKTGIFAGYMGNRRIEELECRLKENKIDQQ